MNDRLEIIVLNTSAEVYTKYVSVDDCMNFLRRVGRTNNFSIVAHKGNKSIFIQRLDPTTLQKELMEFQVKS
jgi:hypothetical protein